MFFEPSVTGQQQSKGETGLPAKPRKQSVRLFDPDDLLERSFVQRFEVDLIRHIRIGHDRGRIGIDENDIDAFLFQNPARLRARIIKFGCLTDDNRSGADHKYFLNRGVPWHV